KGLGGYAVIMLPKVRGKEDELASLIVSELYNDFDIVASIMHTDTLEEVIGYNLNNGQPSYYIKNKGKYYGYIDGVAINQVLLNNERWPFILQTPLKADLTIGIDVKKHLAGYTFTDKYSKNI